MIRTQKGFTLLEVMIAFALLTTILFIAIMAQSSSITSSGRSKNILTATNLARNFINEQELKYEGTPLDKLPQKETGKFSEPNQTYEWEMTFEEVDFSVMSELLAAQAAAKQEAQDAQTETVMKLFENYLKKSVRKMIVTVKYPDGDALSSLTFTQLLVDYEADFATGI